MAQKKTVTVNREDFEEQIGDFFNRSARQLGIPRGEFLSRAMYLACLEYYGENTMRVRVESMREYARKKDLPFKEAVVLDTEGWEQRIRDLRKERFENHHAEHRTLAND